MFGCAIPDHRKGSRWKPVASLFSYCNNEGAWTKGFDRGDGWDRMEDWVERVRDKHGLYKLIHQPTSHYPLLSTSHSLTAANMLRVLLLSAALVVSVSPSQSFLALHIPYKHFMGSIRYIQRILANTAQKYENKFIFRNSFGSQRQPI